MRELTKSVLSFSWAMPLYGMKQILNLSFPRDMSRPFDQAAEGFESVTDAARDQMGATIKGLFDAGDRIQRGMVDLMFSFVPSGVFDPNAWMRTSSDVMQRSVQGIAQAAAAADSTGPSRAAAGAPAGFGSPGGFPGTMPAGPAGPAPVAGWGPIPAPPSRQG